MLGGGLLPSLGGAPLRVPQIRDQRCVVDLAEHAQSSASVAECDRGQSSLYSLSARYNISAVAMSVGELEPNAD